MARHRSVSPNGRPASATGTRNFLVFVVDQLRADHLGCFGNPVVQTPGIDALAARGSMFERAYVANPVCMPNRATIATGRWPSSHGTRTNGITLDPDSRTFMRSLREAGWETVGVGKLHFQTMGWPWEPFQLEEMARISPMLIDPARTEAWNRRREAGWDKYEDAERHRAGYVEIPSGYYGFDSVDLVIGHGDGATGHYTHWARARGVDPEQLGGFERATHRYDGWDQVYRTEIPVQAHPTSYITERTIDHLERLSRGDNDFMLYCSFPDPHHPFTPPGSFWDMYDPTDMPVPASFGAAHHDLPPHIEAILERRGVPPVDPTLTWAPTEEQLRHALAAEFGALTFIDQSIGRVLDAVDRLGLADTTTVVFTSDHGDMFGDHGLMLKHFVHYDATTRIPLIVQLPGSSHQRVESLVSSADLGPTVLDLAGVKPYLGIQGQSLRPLLEQTADTLRERVLIEEDQPFGIVGLPGPVRIRTLVTEHARLSIYANREFGELYDHSLDPEERTNLYAEPAAEPLKADLTAQLAQELIRLDDMGTAPVASA